MTLKVCAIRSANSWPTKVNRHQTNLMSDSNEKTLPPLLAPAEHSSPEAALMQVRNEKRLRLLAANENPYPVSAPQITGRMSSVALKVQYEGLKTGEESTEKYNFCGRIVTRRDMGKATFAHLQDVDGQLQIYVKKELLGETIYQSFAHNLDIGDIIGVHGLIFRTKTGEITLKVETYSLLSKSLRPLPEKWHGLKDVETRARLRELDLISNPESRHIFKMRSKIIQSLRRSLSLDGYAEVETPMMQSVPGGAVARPFETYHNALGQKFYLRVAPELYLKRCLVGGMDKVFELGRVFRNEGIDTTHNPEFTILEAYESYGNMETMMALTEKLIRDCAHATEFKSEFINFDPPFKRISIAQLFRQYVGEEESRMVLDQNWEALAQKTGHAGQSNLTYKVFDYLFAEKIEPNLLHPTFVTEFPVDFSPLAKSSAGSANLTERFELYIQSKEIANAYSELNDPVEQKIRLEKYRNSRVSSTAQEEKEGMGYDESFIQSLEYGMPPAGGLGVGVDRLVMLLTGAQSIRDVLLFPTLRS